MSTRKEGSILIIVLIIATALGIGAYSVLRLVNTEFRLNKRAAINNEAKQAAESLLQSSMADLKNRLENQTAFPIDYLSPSKSPLYISAEFIQIHSDDAERSHLVIPAKTKYTSKTEFNTQPTEIIGGQIPPAEWRYIDPRVPGNQFDELAGTRVLERNIEMLSKATVTRAQVGTTTAYARQVLQVRDAPLFAYAIFYNLPLEIAPGPKMEIFGNMHSNKDAWFQAGKSLDIHSKLTIAGDLNHGRHPDNAGRNRYGDVRITNSGGELVSLKDSQGWMTTGSDDFYDRTNQAYGGNVLTGDHGVLPQNPVGMSDYIEDTNDSTNQKESYNSAYSLIQPTLNESELEVPSQSSDPDGYAAATALNEVEQQKYSYKAGLTITVDSSGNLSYSSPERNSDDSLKYNTAGDPVATVLSPSEPVATYRPFTESNGKISSGLHDKRQAEDLDIIEIDVAALKDLVHANVSTDWGGDGKQQPAEWWNGVVYVDFPQVNSSSEREDNVNPAKSGWGVKLTNAEVIPNPSFAHKDDIYGMSLATNQMLYVEGNYNADGKRSTGSPTEPDYPANFGKQGHEAPASLIADSITFLSVYWNDSKSNKKLKKHRKAGNSEVSAAILTGLVPSGESGSRSYSGGVENFPRFLEHWGGKSLRIRGSMVALFESEVGTRRWGHGGVYSPPSRDWGFHSSFAEGYLPPGTPNTRRYRGIDFKMINKNTYEEYVARVKTNY